MRGDTLFRESRAASETQRGIVMRLNCQLQQRETVACLRGGVGVDKRSLKSVELLFFVVKGGKNLRMGETGRALEEAGEPFLHCRPAAAVKGWEHC